MLVNFIKELFRSRASWDHEDLNRAQLLFQDGQIDFASTILDGILSRSADNASALLLRGTIKRLQSKPQAAIEDVVRAQQLGADAGACTLELAVNWQTLGDIEQSLAYCEQARKIFPESVQAFFLLTQLRMPGEYYLDVLGRIVDYLKPTTYVEIGVFEGSSLRSAKSAQAIVAIDPDPKIKWQLEPHMKVFKSTSDAFFATHDLRQELGQRAVDVAFIDGMHQFEYAMRDFANLERHCKSESVILVHDCYPVDAESSGREPRSTRWSGDVWRLIVLLKKYRPDLTIHTIGAAPTGLAVIQNLDPNSTYLLDNHDRLCQEFLALEYSYLEDNKAGSLNLFPNQWKDIEAMLGSHSF